MGSLPRTVYHAGKNRRVIGYDHKTKQIKLDGGYVISRGGQRVPAEPAPEPEQLTLFRPQKFAKRRAPLTDQQLGRRKRIQAHISQAGSTAGLTSLGLLGASVVAGRRGKPVAAKLRSASVNTGIVGAGIGGVGGFNFARIQSEEARRREMPQKVTLKKRSDFDPEARRHRRQKAYATGLAVGSGGAAGAAGASTAVGGYRLVQAAHEGRQANAGSAWAAKAEGDRHGEIAAKERKAKKSGSAARARGAEAQRQVWRQGARNEVKVARGRLANKSVRLAQAKGSGKKALVAAGVSAALAGGTAAVERHRRRGGASYNGWWEHRY